MIDFGRGVCGDLAVAASSALRSLLDATDRRTATEALDMLVTAALDSSADRRVRIAAFDALRDVPGDVRERVAGALERDPDARLQAHAVEGPREAATAEAVWQDALEGRLPDTPGVLRDAVQARAPSAALGLVRKMIDEVRTREAGEKRAERRAEWQSVRGALHQALALRGSRVALYDLRESLEQAAGTLPVSFLAALHVVGDRSCLDPLAAAWSRASAGEAHWRHQLAAAFRMIARREKITQRHAVMKRIAARWPDAIDELSGR